MLSAAIGHLSASDRRPSGLGAVGRWVESRRGKGFAFHVGI